MSRIKLDNELLKKYFTGIIKHPLYDKAVKDYNRFKVHFDGEYSKDLIERKRPNENDEVRDYRKAIWKEITYMW